MWAAVLLAGAVASAPPPGVESGVQSMLNEESPDVFLAKATLQQYLSRVVRKDWEAARRLTHPKALNVISQLKRRTGVERHNLAPWANQDVQLKTFRFIGTRQVSPGAVLVEVGEDSYRPDEGGMSVDDPAVYFLFRSRGQEGGRGALGRKRPVGAGGVPRIHRPAGAGAGTAGIGAV